MTIEIGRGLRALLAALALVLAVPAFAIDTEAAFDDPALQQRYETINRELRCLVCQNQTIADSNASLAGQLRHQVREMIEDGKSDQEIRDFMIQRYGDWVLYKPRMTASNFLLLASPVLLLILGMFIGIRYIRRQAAESGPDSPEADQS